MLTVEQIKEALSDRHLRTVAERVGLTTKALENIRSGNVKRPHRATLKVLSEYLERPL